MFQIVVIVVGRVVGEDRFSKVCVVHHIPDHNLMGLVGEKDKQGRVVIAYTFI